jgi:hypothetical protein
MTPQVQESKTALKRKVENFDISKVDETLMLASDLSRFIKENRLFHNIQGKEYVNVEGWQYAGARLGIIPIVEELDNLSTAEELKYQAKVQLMNLMSGQVIGSGFAICSNKEQGKKFYQEYAIASMAQTRAIGKAYRNILAWIIRAAGYEPTPAEEMDAIQNTESMNNFQKNGQKANSQHGFSGVKSPAFEAAPVVTINKQNPETPKTENKPAENQEKEEPVLENPATAKQKQQILLLLNNPVFTEDEKAKMVAQLNKIDTDKADKAITKLKKLIEERQKDGSKIAA